MRTGAILDVQERQNSAKDGDRKSRRENTERGAIRLAALGRFFDGDGLLFTHGRDDGDKQVLALIKVGLDLLAQITLRDLDVVLGNTVLGHEVEETIVDVDELVFVTADVGDIHVVGGRTDIFHFFAGEDVYGDEVDLGVSVLASLGGGHLDNLAGAALNDDVPVLTKGRALHGESERGSGGGLVKVVLVLLIVGHGGSERR